MTSSICVFHPYTAYLVHFVMVLISCMYLFFPHFLSFIIICHFCGIGINLEPIHDLSGVVFLLPCIKSSDLWVNLWISLNLWNPWNPWWNPQIYADFQQGNPWISCTILRFSLNPQADLSFVHPLSFFRLVGQFSKSISISISILSYFGNLQHF